MKKTYLALACIFFNLSYGMEQNNQKASVMRGRPELINMEIGDETSVAVFTGNAQTECSAELRNRVSSITKPNELQKHPTNLSLLRSKQPSTCQKLALGGLTLLSQAVPVLAEDIISYDTYEDDMASCICMGSFCCLLVSCLLTCPDRE